MKTSRRLLLGTFLAILAVPVAFTAYSRLAGTGSTTELPPPERTPVAELATLRDFDTVEISGDLGVELVASQDYFIDFTPLNDRRGNFTAQVQDGRLQIEAFGNRTETTAATVRIGMPSLRELDAEFLNSLTIRDFDVEDMNIDLAVAVAGLVLQDNRIGVLDLTLQRGDIEFRNNMIGTSRITQFGNTITTE